jgi:hypothetical protein
MLLLTPEEQSKSVHIEDGIPEQKVNTIRMEAIDFMISFSKQMKLPQGLILSRNLRNYRKS